MFAFSGLMFVGIYYTVKTEFAYWYGLALLLIAIGLMCLLSRAPVGETVKWVGRSALYLGSSYFIFALLAGRREMRRTSSSATATNRWGLWPYLEQKVNERMLALERANEDLQKQITGRERAEEELKESEERLRLAADAAGFGIYSYDFASGAGYWSPEFKALLGVPPNQPFVLDKDSLFVGLHPESTRKLPRGRDGGQ